MKITYLPEVTNPSLTSVYFPAVIGGIAKTVGLSQLSISGVTPGVSSVKGGQNFTTSPKIATKYATLSFDFPGAIFPCATPTPPDGWLFCHGQNNLSRVVYSRLFETIGVSYGQGDGRTTFGIPDLRGRVILGLDTMGGSSASGRITGSVSGNVPSNLGQKGGTEYTTLEVNQVPAIAHTHNVSSITSGFSCGIENGNRCSGNNTRNRGMFRGGSAVNFNFSFTLSTQSATAEPHANIPPLAFYNWAIKY